MEQQINKKDFIYNQYFGYKSGEVVNFLETHIWPDPYNPQLFDYKYKDRSYKCNSKDVEFLSKFEELHRVEVIPGLRDPYPPYKVSPPGTPVLSKVDGYCLRIIGIKKKEDGQTI